MKKESKHRKTIPQNQDGKPDTFFKHPDNFAKHRGKNIGKP